VRRVFVTNFLGSYLCLRRVFARAFGSLSLSPNCYFDMGKKSTRGARASSSRAPQRPPTPPSSDDGQAKEFLSNIFKKHSDFLFSDNVFEVGFKTEEALERFRLFSTRTHKNTLWISQDLLAKFGCEASIRKVFEAIGIDQYAFTSEPSYAPN